MAITNIDDYWKKPPKPENGLSEDGEYFTRAGLGEVKSVHDNASEVIEIPLVVDEGEYAGEEIKLSYFILNRGQWQESALERLKVLRDKTDPRLATLDFIQSIDTMLAWLNGRRVKISQRTAKNGKAYHDLLEVCDPTMGAFQQQSAPPVQQAPPIGSIPF